jgi:hypothetical protein
MEFITKHWLGIMVLSTFTWYAIAVQGGHYQKGFFPGLIFLLLFGTWLLRGFVRFLGRAWHHGATRTR